MSVNVSIDKKNKMFHCNSCGTNFQIDEEPQNHIVNNFFYSHDLDDNQNKIDKRIKSADYYMIKLKNYDRARDIFESITDDAPDDYRGWWGLIRVDNYNLNSRRAFEHGLDPHEYEEDTEYFKYIAITAPKPVVQKLRALWDAYLRRYDKFALGEKLEELQSRLDELDKQIGKSQEDMKKATYDHSVYYVKTVSLAAAGIAILMILADHGSRWNLLLVALFCLLADFVLYNNLFDVVELICSDLHATLEKERGNLSKLGKERSKLKEQIKELKDKTA